MIQPFNPQLNQQIQQFVQAEQMNRPGPRQTSSPEDRRFAQGSQEDNFTVNMANIANQRHLGFAEMASRERSWANKNRIDQEIANNRLAQEKSLAEQSLAANQQNADRSHDLALRGIGLQQQQLDFEQQRLIEEENRREADRRAMEEASALVAQRQAELERLKIERLKANQNRKVELTDQIDGLNEEMEELTLQISRGVRRTGQAQANINQQLTTERRSVEAQRRAIEQSQRFAVGAAAGLEARLIQAVPTEFAEGGTYGALERFDREDGRLLRETGLTQGDHELLEEEIVTSVASSLRTMTNQNIPDGFSTALRDFMRAVRVGDVEDVATRTEAIQSMLRQANVSPYILSGLIANTGDALTQRVAQMAQDGFGLPDELRRYGLVGEDGRPRAMTYDSLGFDSSYVDGGVASSEAYSDLLRDGSVGAMSDENRFLKYQDEIARMNRMVTAVRTFENLEEALSAGAFPDISELDRRMRLLDRLSEGDDLNRFESLFDDGDLAAAEDFLSQGSAPASLSGSVGDFLNEEGIQGGGWYDQMAALAQAYEDVRGDFRSDARSDIREMREVMEAIEEAERTSGRLGTDLDIGLLEDSMESREEFLEGITDPRVRALVIQSLMSGGM